MKIITTIDDQSKPRIIKRFAFFPVTLWNMDRLETRWLETVYIEQHYGFWAGWESVSFSTESEYKGMKDDQAN